MAQILKEEIKNRIVDSAKEELLTYGFENASLRRIALKSKMTVGNLYHYFKNKDALIEYIVNPVLGEINELVMEITSNNISISSMDFKATYTVDELRLLLNILIDRLGDIAFKWKSEFKILLMGSKIHNEIIEWFKNLIRYFIMTNYNLKDYTGKVKIISSCYATSIVEGFRQCLSDSEDEKIFKEIIKIYMLSYIRMLENDIGKYIGE